MFKNILSSHYKFMLLTLISLFFPHQISLQIVYLLRFSKVYGNFIKKSLKKFQKMQSETAKKYEEFNFSTDPRWRAYFDNLFPTPSFDMVDKIKRKWYRKNIDPNFNDINENIPFNTSNQTGNINPNINPQQQSANTNPRVAQPPSTLFKIEGYLKLAFIPGLIFSSGFHLKILVVFICLMAILRNFGAPKFNKEYLLKVIPSEFTANLLYLLAISLVSSQNGFVFFLPIAIHLSSGIVEFLSRTNPSLLINRPKLNEFATLIKNNRNHLIIAKNKIEFCIFIYLILLTLFGGSSLFQIIIYLQFLNLKYKFNGNMQTAIWEVRNYLVGNVSLPSFFRNFIAKFFDLFIRLMNAF